MSNTKTKSANFFKDSFSGKLYVEGLKKIRVAGIIAAILCVVLSAIVPIVMSITEATTHYETTPTKSIVGATEYCVPLLMVLFFAILMPFSMFSFLDKRNEADFFHAIPYKRRCVYTSFLAAIFTWLWAIILASVIICLPLWLAVPHHALDFSVLWKLPVLYFIATGVLVGMALLAKMISGTKETNVFAFAVILLFVRYILAVFSAVFESEVPYVRVGDFFRIDFLMPFAMFSNLSDIAFGAGNDLNVLGIGRILYNTILAIILLVLSGVIYCRRRSECAGKTTAYKPLQGVLRVICALVLAILLPLNFFYWGSEGALTLIITVAALLVYCIYELITVKRVKAMVKALPGLLIVLALTVVLFLPLPITINHYKNETISADNIKFVEMRENDYGQRTYEDVKLGAVRLDDEEVFKIIETGYMRNKSTDDRNNHPYYYDYAKGSDIRNYWFTIRLKSGKTIVRSVRLTEAEYECIEEEKYLTMLEKQKSENFLAIPDQKEMRYCNAFVFPIGWVSEFDSNELYAIFSEEYKTLSDERKLAVRNESCDIRLDVGASVNGVYTSNNYYIHGDLPKTLDYLLNHINYESDTVDKIIAAIASDTAIGNVKKAIVRLEIADPLSVGVYTQIDYIMYTEGGVSYLPDDLNFEAECKEVIRILNDAVSDNKKDGTNVLIVRTFLDSEDEYKDGFRSIRLDKEDFDTVCKFIKDYEAGRREEVYYYD